MTRGIHNPFLDPAQAPKPKLDYDQAMAEKQRQALKKAAALCTIELDGGSHVLKLEDVTVETIKDRLGVIVKSIQDASPELQSELRRAGVFISNQAVLDVEAYRLDTPSGVLHVCDVPEGKAGRNETRVYQRLAYALSLLPVKQILAAHKASIITRG